MWLNYLACAILVIAASLDAGRKRYEVLIVDIILLLFNIYLIYFYVPPEEDPYDF